MTSKRKGFKPLLPSLEADVTDAEIFKAVWERNAEEHRILNEIADSLKIPEGPFREILTLWELARHHVPEFKERGKEGAREKWNDHNTALFANWVVIVMNLLDVKKNRACEALAMACPWLFSAKGKPDGSALAKQCTSHRMSVARKALSDAERTGTVEAFIAENRKAWNEFKAKEERN